MEKENRTLVLWSNSQYKEVFKCEYPYMEDFADLYDLSWRVLSSHIYDDFIILDDGTPACDYISKPIEQYIEEKLNKPLLRIKFKIPKSTLNTIELFIDSNKIPRPKIYNIALMGCKGVGVTSFMNKVVEEDYFTSSYSHVCRTYLDDGQEIAIFDCGQDTSLIADHDLIIMLYIAASCTHLRGRI